MLVALVYSWHTFFFGDDVMQGSTLKGKGNRTGLDPHKLEVLMSVIHERSAFRN